jgi:uncharacterized protein YbaR (Trm112 family)
MNIYDILVCTKCKNELEKKKDHLLCHECGLKFQIDENIPNMILEDAKELR